MPVRPFFAFGLLIEGMKSKTEVILRREIVHRTLIKGEICRSIVTMLVELVSTFDQLLLFGIFEDSGIERVT